MLIENVPTRVIHRYMNEPENYIRFARKFSLITVFGFIAKSLDVYIYIVFHILYRIFRSYEQKKAQFERIILFLVHIWTVFSHFLAFERVNAKYLARPDGHRIPKNMQRFSGRLLILVPVFFKKWDISRHTIRKHCKTSICNGFVTCKRKQAHPSCSTYTILWNEPYL